MIIGRWSLFAASAGILASCAVGWLWHRDVKGTWLSMRHAYSAADPPGPEGAWVVRLLVLVLVLVLVLASVAALVLCPLRLMPRRRLPLITTLGADGFTIYLLHPLVILPARELGWTARVNTPVEVVGLVLCTVPLTMVLGSPPVRRLVRPLTRPPAGWLFAPATPGPQQPERAPTPAPSAPPALSAPSAPSASPAPSATPTPSASPAPSPPSRPEPVRTP